MAATRVKGGGAAGARRRGMTLSYGTAAALGHSGRVGESLGRSGLGRGRRRGKNGVQGGGEKTVEQVYFDFGCPHSSYLTHIINKKEKKDSGILF